MGNDKATYLSAGAQDWAKVSGWWPRLVTGLVVLAMSLVDFLRGLIRPGATAYTLALQTALLWWVGDLYRQRQLTLSAGQQAELVMLVVGTTSYLCTTCVVWWFGARPQSRR